MGYGWRCASDGVSLAGRLGLITMMRISLRRLMGIINEVSVTP